MKRPRSSNVSSLPKKSAVVIFWEDRKYTVKLQPFCKIKGSDGKTFFKFPAVPVKIGNLLSQHFLDVYKRQIQSIHLVNLSESTAAMFPLMEPALESLASQIYTNQSLENIQYTEDQKYTSCLLYTSADCRKCEDNPAW